jgi:hypothetical protein
MFPVKNKVTAVFHFHVRRGGAYGGEKEDLMKEVTMMSSLYLVGTASE